MSDTKFFIIGFFTFLCVGLFLIFANESDIKPTKIICINNVQYKIIPLLEKDGTVKRCENAQYSDD